MKEVKRQTSRSYDEYFISALKNPERAAGYLEVMLEPDDPDTELLRAALKDVIDARIQMNNLSESAKLKWQQLDQMLAERGSDEIYTLVELLDALGFKIAVTVK